MRIGAEEILNALRLITTLFSLALVEAFARGLGAFDYYVKGDKQILWDIAWTTKKVDAEQVPSQK